MTTDTNTDATPSTDDNPDQVAQDVAASATTTEVIEDASPASTPAQDDPAPRAIDPRAEQLALRANQAHEDARPADGEQPAVQTEEASISEELPPAEPEEEAPLVLDGFEFTKNQAGQYVTKLPVNGVDQEMTMSQISTNAQKVASADQNFRDAARLRDEALRMGSTQPAPNPPQGDSAPPTGEQPPSVTTETIEKAIFTDGDEGDKARELMAERLNPAPAQPLDKAAIVSEVRQEVRDQMRVEDAITSVRQSPHDAEILDNHAQLADAHSATLLTTEPHLSERENIEKACALTRTQLGIVIPPPPTGETEMNQRSAKKQANANASATSAAPRAAMTQPAPVYNPNDAINDMRRARGMGV